MLARRLIALYALAILAAMTWVSWFASTAPTITSLPQYAALAGKEGINVIDGFVTVCSEPWGLATMFDAYFGFLAFFLYVAWRERSALARTAPYLLDKYAAYLSWGIPGIELAADAAPVDQLRALARNRFALGSPGQVVDALLAQHRAGVTHATMRISWPGMPQDDVLASIELLGTTVLPEVRRRIAAGA